MPIETLNNFRDLLAYLSERNAPHQADLGGQVIEMPAKAPPIDDVVYVRWEKKLPYLQIIQPVIRNVDPTRTPAVEEALCRLNDYLPLSLLGLAYDRRFIYLRRCLPVYDEGLRPQVFERELLVTIRIAQEMHAPLSKVIAGEPAERVVDALPKGS